VHALLRRGHQIDYFCARVEAQLEHPAFRVVPISQPRRPTSLRVALFAARSAAAIAQAESTRRYDVVQGFGRTWYQTLYRDGSGCHADYRATYLDRVKRPGFLRSHRLFPSDRVVQGIERRRYAKRPPRAVVAISRLVREQILRRYALAPERVRLLYSGVDLERNHPRLAEAGRAELARACGSGRALVFVGSDFRRKGLLLLLDALALLEREPSFAARDYALAVVGRDNRPETWREWAAQRGVLHRVRFLGFRRDVPALLAGADVLALPSWFDAFGNVVAEALACGTPAVVSASCGAAEWIRDGENGFVVPRPDPALWAARLRALLASGAPAHMRDMARRTALAYPWDAHVDALLAICREVAQERAAAPA
jgi:UDP-glucose:(heptosyl)LPS alpha-1,3-glucosyltransferase